jgi:hypothetical protein
MTNPGADLRLEPGDAVGVLGTPEQRAAFRALARKPKQDDTSTQNHHTIE